MGASENKQLVEEAFAAWSKGEGTFFDLLAEDALWTITGSSPLAGTFTSKREFLEQAIGQVGPRLAEPLRPTVVEQVIGDGDTVAVVWSLHAMATDGLPYDNRYCWVMRVRGRQVTEVIAWFDSGALEGLLERVKPAPA